MCSSRSAIFSKALTFSQRRRVASIPVQPHGPTKSAWGQRCGRWAVRAEGQGEGASLGLQGSHRTSWSPSKTLVAVWVALCGCSCSAYNVCAVFVWRSLGWVGGVWLWKMATPKWSSGGWKMSQQPLGSLGGAYYMCWERMAVTFVILPQFYLSREGILACIGSMAFMYCCESDAYCKGLWVLYLMSIWEKAGTGTSQNLRKKQIKEDLLCLFLTHIFSKYLRNITHMRWKGWEPGFSETSSVHEILHWSRDWLHWPFSEVLDGFLV